MLVSQGFPRESPPSGRASRIPELDGVVRAASRYHLPIYTVDPSVASENPGDPAERDRSVAMLQWLATQTGGRATEAATLTAGMARLKHDFESTTCSLSPRTGRRAISSDRVQSQTPRRVVHTPPGYWAPPEASGDRTSTPQRWRSRSPGGPAPEPLIDAWVGLVRAADGTEMVIPGNRGRAGCPRRRSWR